MLRVLRRVAPFGKWRIDQLANRLTPRTGREIVTAQGLTFDVDRGDFVQRQICVTGEYEPYLCAALHRHLRPGSIFFDIGANIGYLSLFAWKLGAKVYSFEPNPAARLQMVRNIQLNRADITLFDFGLSDSAGTLPLYLDETGNSGASSLGNRRSKSVDIRLETLDSLDLPLPDVIKIDIEGAEVKALRGASKVLQARPVILCEVSDWSLRLLGSSSEELFDILDGYRSTIISPIRRSIADERRVYFQYDVLFLPDTD